MELEEFERRLFQSMEDVTRDSYSYNSFFQQLNLALLLFKINRYSNFPILIGRIEENVYKTLTPEELLKIATFYMILRGAIDVSERDETKININEIRKSVYKYLYIYCKGDEKCISEKLYYHLEKWKEFFETLQRNKIPIVVMRIDVITPYGLKDYIVSTDSSELFRFLVKEIRKVYEERLNRTYEISGN
ncbi:MAG: hypothetical protein QXQ14_00645 [Candidatus Aenigmatarchaeota archaeon]